jgi:hypothetical protein
MNVNNFSYEAKQVFNNDEAEMLQFSKLLLDNANSDYSEYSKVDAKSIIKAKFNEILGFSADAKPNNKEMRKAIRKHKIDIYEIIEETMENMLVSGWAENPFFIEYVDTKNLQDGDKNLFYSPDETMLTVSQFSGNHHNLMRQKLGFGQEFSVKTSWFGVKIYQDFELVATGRMDFADMIQKMYKAFDKKITDMLYLSFTSADTVLANAITKTITVSTATKGDVLGLVEEISTNTVDEVIIIGTRSALSKLIATSGDAWISEDMKKERHTTGGLGQFEGIRLMVLPQVNDVNTRNKLIDNNKLYVFPVSADFKPIKFVNEGEAYFHEVADSETNVDMTIESEYMQKFGIATVTSKDFGVITIA